MFRHTRIPQMPTSRVGRFALVGVGGLVIQMIVLDLLTRVAALDYRAATVLAVEAAVLHNFAWHERWTWRVPHGSGSRLVRAARFHTATALLSIVGNLCLMSLLVGHLGWPVLLANVVAVTILGVANFQTADLWVFRHRRGEVPAATTTPVGRSAARRDTGTPVTVAVGSPLVIPGPAFAGPPPETVSAWTRYVAMTERRITPELGDGRRFLTMYFEAGRSQRDRQRLQNGSVLIKQVATGGSEAGSIDV